MTVKCIKQIKSIKTGSTWKSETTTDKAILTNGTDKIELDKASYIKSFRLVSE